MTQEKPVLRTAEQVMADRRSATEVNQDLLRQQIDKTVQQEIEKAAQEIKEREEKNFRDGCAVMVIQGLASGYAWYFRKTAAGVEAGCDQELALPALAKLSFDMADAMLAERRKRDLHALQVRMAEKNANRIIEDARVEGIEIFDYFSNEDILNLDQTAEEFLKSFREAHKRAAESNLGTKWGARWHKHFLMKEAANEANSKGA